MEVRTWKRGPFPDRLWPEWQQPQSDVTHDPWWAEHWRKLGCEVVEVPNAPEESKSGE